MFSRLAASSAKAVRASSSRMTTPRTFLATPKTSFAAFRQIHTTKPQQNSAAAATPAEEEKVDPNSVNGIVQAAGGWYPLGGLALAVGLSKELIILNEEIFVLGSFATFVLGVYVTQGQAIYDGLMEDYHKIKKAHEGAYNVEIEAVKREMAVSESKLTLSDDLGPIVANYKELAPQVDEALTIIGRQKQRDAIEARLQAIAQREQIERDEEVSAAQSDAVAAVRKYFESVSAKDAQKVNDFYVSSLGNPLDTAKEPVLAKFKELADAIKKQK